MENNTVSLLNECSSGCKMAVNSLKQIQEHVKNQKFHQLLEAAIEKHKDYDKKAAGLLAQCGKEEKEPGMAAVTFAWTMAEMKILMKQTDSQLAMLVMDGCNMGVKTLSKALNDYPNGSAESVELTNVIIQANEDLMSDVKVFR